LTENLDKSLDSWPGFQAEEEVERLVVEIEGVPERAAFVRAFGEEDEGKIHRVDPDFGSTLTVSNTDSQVNCWVNWKIIGQPCELQVMGTRGREVAVRGGAAARQAAIALQPTPRCASGPWREAGAR
jgi:hypothetical protein